MKIVTLIITILIVSCSSQTIVVHDTIVNIKNLKFDKVIAFENNSAIFYSDLDEFITDLHKIKDSDSIKYKNCREEINYVLAFDVERKDTLKIKQDSIIRTFLVEGFIKKEIETGQLSIFEKKNQTFIKSIKISKPYVTHFSVFKVYLNNDEADLIFERKILMVAR